MDIVRPGYALHQRNSIRLTRAGGGLMNIKTTALAIASTILLAGCGGGGSSGGAGGGDTPRTVAGKAADGYLSGATVCLDLNGNKRCDAGEPASTTGTGGAFSIQVPDGTDPSAYAIVVEVGASTVDEDTGAPVGKPYVLAAPPGKPDFVSPLTTAVLATMERNPALTADEAAVQVQQSIGADSGVSLFEDYVAAKQDSGNTAADDYARLHNIAQVSAKVLAENHEVIMAAAADQGLDPEQVYDALLTLVVEQVLEQLEQAALAVDDAGDEFDVGTVTVDTANTEGLAEQVDEAEAATGFAAISAQSLLSQGFHWLWAEDGEYEYGKVAAGTAEGTLEEQWYSYDGTTWVAMSDDAEDPEFYLGPNGWTQALDAGPNFVVSYNNDGSATLKLEGMNFLKFTGAELDVGGESIKTFLQYASHQPFAAAISADPLFDTGAKVYQANFIVDGDRYAIATWTGCLAEHADPNGNCNVIYGHSGHATSFADVMYLDGAEPTGSSFGVGDGLDLRIYANGTVHISDQSNSGEVSYGSWAYRTVHGEQLMMLTLPSKFAGRLWDDGQPFLAVQGGYLRRGSFLPNGVLESEGELLFNQTAFQNIMDHLSLGAAPAPTSSAIVGSWHLADEDVVITFLSTGNYMMVHGGVADDVGQPGMEFGNYQWDSSTGAFTATPSVDQNGEWGISHPLGAFTVTVDSNALTIVESERPADSATLSRVAQGTGTIAGSWMQGVVGEYLVVITFLDNGKYFHGEVGTADAAGQPGQEIGAYTWTQATGLLSADSIAHDSNGEWGLSHPQGELYADVVGGQLQVGEATDVVTLQEVGAP